MKHRPWIFALVLLIASSLACQAVSNPSSKATTTPTNTIPALVATTVAPTSSTIPATISPTAAPSATATFPPIPTATVDETQTLIKAIQAALVDEHGPDAASLTITVDKIEGNYAQGGASAQGGGAMWFAAKINGQWKLVWDGNGQIDCASLAPYPDFPTDMIPECWDSANNKLVTR
jgi:hypothetical protein